MGKPVAPERVGDRIRQARFQRQAHLGRAVTQTALAKTLGVSPGAVSQWENGTTEPSLAVLPKLAQALGVSAGWLAFGEEPAADDPTNPATARRLTEAELDRADAAAAKKRGDGPRRKAQ